MQCPSCQKDSKDNSKFCVHCGQQIASPSTQQSDPLEVHKPKMDIEPIHSSEASEPLAELVPSKEQSGSTEQIEAPKPAFYQGRLPLFLALLAAASSALMIWCASFLLSALSNRSLLAAFWDTIAAQLLHIPLEKAVLFNQELRSSVWLIANAFTGGSYIGKYFVDGNVVTTFEVQNAILLILIGTALITSLHIKMISAQITKRQLPFGLFTKAVITAVYMLTTWLLIVLPLLIFAPSLHIPFVDAPEQLKIGVGILPSLINTALVIVTSAVLAWIPWKQWRTCRHSFTVAAICTALIGASQLFVQLWTSSALSWQHLIGLHSSGLDLLWLNRFVIRLLLSFGGAAPYEHSFYSSTLGLPEGFTGSLSLLLILAAAVIALLPVAQAGWKERIAAALLSIWIIFVLFQLIKIQIRSNTFEEHVSGLPPFSSFVYQLAWLNFVIPAVIILAMLLLGKWLGNLLFKKVNALNKSWISHLWKRSLIYSSVLLLLLIALNTSIELSHAEPSTIRDVVDQKTKNEIQWAKQIYLLQEGTPQYALKKAKELWTEQGTAESKALLAIAYLQAYEPDRAYALLNEGLRTKNKLFPAKALSELMEASHLSDPLSVIYQGPQVASSGQEAVVYSLQEAIDVHIRPEMDELLDQAADEVLPALIGEHLTTVQTQMKLDPEYIDFVKMLVPGKLEQLQASYVDASTVLMKEIVELEQVIGTLQNKDDESTSETVDAIHNEWAAFVVPKADYLMSLARAAIYFGDHDRAEEWLALVNSYLPMREDAAVLLSYLYLNGEQPSSKHLEQSAAYEEAVNQAAKALKSKLETLLHNISITTEEALKLKVESAYMSEEIRTQIAYALLLPFEDEPSTDVLYQLAKYYFQTGQEQEAAHKIAELEARVTELEAEQQYLIQKLDQLPVHTNEMTIEQMEEKHELTESLYKKLEPTAGKQLNEKQLTGEQQAFSVYLSNELLSFKKSSAQITSIQHKEGTVTVYVKSDNAELTKAGLSLFDNSKEITSFEMTKLSETSAFNRYVMLILDKSSSMDGQKIEVAKQSAIDFVKALQYKESIGLIEFSNDAKLAMPFTSSYPQMTRALSKIHSDGGTNIAPALRLGIDELQQSNGERIAFILSDGEDSNFSNVVVRQQLIQRANEAGVTIYAVGFDAGYQTLRDVAEGTGGQYIGATDFESLSRSFDKIRETLSRTYQIRYSINPTDYGTHTVRLEQGEYADSKKYSISDPNAVSVPDDDGSGAEKFTVADPIVKSDSFSVSSYSPHRILISKSGSTKITIQGTKLNEVERIQFGGKALDFKRVNDQKITITISNQQRSGKHSLTLVTKDRKEEQLSLTFSNSAAQQSIAFGYSTLYGDLIEPSKGSIKLVGDVSIDHFIYPNGDTMLLRNDEELTFKGVNIKTNNTTQRMFKNEMKMTSSQFGKQFSIESQGAISQAASSLPGLDRFGIELKLLPVMSYAADMKSEDGTFTIRGGMTNFYKLYMLNKNVNQKIKIKGQPIKFLPSDASAAIDYTKSGYTLSGTAGLNLYMQGIGFDGVTLSFTYPHSDKRLILKGQVTGMELFNMKTSNQNSSRITLEVGVHFSNGLDRVGAELASNRSIPLGASGLGLYKFGFLADWSAKNAGSMTLGVDTVIDTAYTKFINSIEKIPVVNKVFDFDPAMCLICVDGTIGFTEMATTNWGLNGKLSAELIGFKVAEVTAKVNKKELEMQTMMSKLIYNMDSSANMVFKDSAFQNHTTLKFRTMIDAVGFNPHTFTVVYVPAQFNYSYAELSKEKKGKQITIQRIGNKLNIVR